MNRRLPVLLTLIIVACASVLYVMSWSNQPLRTENLFEAIRHGDLDTVERFIQAGGSPNTKVAMDAESVSLLRLAVIDREEEIALALLDAGAEPSLSGASLITAAANGMDRVIQRLLPVLIPAQLRDGDLFDTGLVRTADNGYYDVVETYLRFSKTADYPWDAELGRAAVAATIAGYDDVARLLLEAGASSDDLLHVASRFGSPGLVRDLIESGADPTGVLMPPVPSIVERTPLDFALKRFRDESGYYAQVRPAFQRSSDAEHVLFELLRAGADPGTSGAEQIARDGLGELLRLTGDEKLVGAARSGFLDVARELLADGSVWTADVLRQAVVTALENDHDDVARFLLESGAPTDGPVLHTAAATSSPGMVRYLLRLGADVSSRIDDQTAVHWWLNKSSTEDPEYILHELIAAGADVCWLVGERDRLPGLSAVILRDSAPECQDGATNGSRHESRDVNGSVVGVVRASSFLFGNKHGWRRLHSRV
jgi:ankyrin repeat protein